MNPPSREGSSHAFSGFFPPAGRGLLTLVYFDGVVEDVESYVCRGEDLRGVTTGVIAAVGDDSGHPAACDEHCTDPARLHGAIHGGSIQLQPIASSLDDGVLLGMHGPYTVLTGGAVIIDGLLEVMADIVTVRHPRGRSNVSGADDAFVTDHNTATLAPVACGASRDLVDKA